MTTVGILGGNTFIAPECACPRSLSCIFDMARDAEGPLVGDSVSSSLASVGCRFAWSTELTLDPDSVAEDEPVVTVDEVAEEGT